MTPSRVARKADIEAVAWSVSCPACGDDIASPNGSLMWTHEDRQAAILHPCSKCGTRVRIPGAT